MCYCAKWCKFNKVQKQRCYKMIEVLKGAKGSKEVLKSDKSIYVGKYWTFFY